jgi:hypothetical protein
MRVRNIIWTQLHSAVGPIRGACIADLVAQGATVKSMQSVDVVQWGRAE